MYATIFQWQREMKFICCLCAPTWLRDIHQPLYHCPNFMTTTALTKRSSLPLKHLVTKKQKYSLPVPFPNDHPPRPCLQKTSSESPQMPLTFHLSEYERKNTLLGKHRNTVALKMMEMVCRERLMPETWFLSTYILDFMLKKDQRRDKIQVLGATALFTASKYEEIHPLSLKLLTHRIYFSSLSREDILREERRILSAMDFQLTVQCSPLNELENCLLLIDDNVEILRCLTEYLVNLSNVCYTMRIHTPSHIAHAALILASSATTSQPNVRHYGHGTTKACIGDLCDVIRKNHVCNSPMRLLYNQKLHLETDNYSLDDFILC